MDLRNGHNRPEATESLDAFERAIRATGACRACCRAVSISWAGGVPRGRFRPFRRAVGLCKAVTRLHPRQRPGGWKLIGRRLCVTGTAQSRGSNSALLSNVWSAALNVRRDHGQEKCRLQSGRCLGEIGSREPDLWKQRARRATTRATAATFYQALRGTLRPRHLRLRSRPESGIIGLKSEAYGEASR